MPRLTRRQRLLLIAAGSSVAFLGVASVAAWRWVRPGPTYRPGEVVEGVTSDLTRALPTDHPKVVFADVTRQSGIDFRHFSGTRSSQLPEDMGSGAAWGDYDNDGWLDLVVANEVGPLSMSDEERRRSPVRTTLYHNNHDGTFTDVTTTSGIDSRGWDMGVAWGDYDNDGRIDLVVTSYGRNSLYHNEGDGTFTDRSAASRIGTATGFWAGGSWGDYDRDGFLDLYVTGYVRYTHLDSAERGGKYDVENPASINPSSFPPERNLLYHNNRDGTFTEVAKSAGVVDTAGRGLSAAWADFDEDGWPDLYVANDQSDNAFYRNLGNGTFADLSHAARVADYRSAMGIAVGDWDGDGDQDMFLTHWIAQENALYSNSLAQTRSRPAPAPLTFMDDADRYGLGQTSLDFVGWATSFIDYDNDGTLDLFVVNGSTLQKRDNPSQLVPMRNQLFWNRGGMEGFFDVAVASGPAFARELVGRGAAFGDYDNDGDIDAFIVNHGGPGLLLRNDGGNRNHWLQVEVRGTKSNRQAIGARLRLVTGSTVGARQVGAQASYLSQNSLVETFGLGAATRADTLEIWWPSGARDVRVGLTANQRIVVTEGQAASGDDRARIQSFWNLYREATAQRTAGRTQLASDTYARALELNPDHEDVLYYYGSMRLALGDFDGAARAWHHLVAVNASSARTHSQLGTLYLCPEPGAPFQLDSAERHLRRAHEINKEENGPVLRLGEVALMRGDLASARRYFATVLATHAGSALAHFYAGYIAWKNDDTAVALEDFRQATPASPAARPARVPGEGDTKRGTTPLATGESRCNQLRALAERPRGTDPERDMARRYRELDDVLSAMRRRAH
jgi:Flp pilus assembly protein TadD